MSGKLLGAAWEVTGLTSVTKLVLLAVADSADDDYRLTALSVETLARRIDTTVRSVYRALNALQARGILQDHVSAPHKIKKQLSGYGSNLRQLSPQDSWSNITTDNLSVDTSQVLVLEEANVTTPVTLVTPYREAITTNPIDPLETSSLESLDNVPVVDLEAETRPRPGRKIRPKSKLGISYDEDEGYDAGADPAAQLFGAEEEPDTQPLQDPTNRWAAYDAVPKGKGRTVGPAEATARYFAAAGRQSGAGPGIGNVAALSGSFSKWVKNDGMTYEQIKRMIDAFWTAGYRRNERSRPWEDFLAQRAILFDRLRGENVAAEIEANQENPDYWTRTD